jgi:hypothetical protein
MATVRMAMFGPCGLLPKDLDHFQGTEFHGRDTALSRWADFGPEVGQSTITPYPKDELVGCRGLQQPERTQGAVPCRFGGNCLTNRRLIEPAWTRDAAVVITTSTVITVITTPTLSSLAEGSHRLQNRSAPERT